MAGVLLKLMGTTLLAMPGGCATFGSGDRSTAPAEVVEPETPAAPERDPLDPITVIGPDGLPITTSPVRPIEVQELEEPTG